jgi:hypothetical protein
MTHTPRKLIFEIISRAENDNWYDCRSLVRLLSFAIKLRELAFAAQFGGHRGRRAAVKIGLLLPSLVGDPARTAENPRASRALSELAWWLKQPNRGDAYSDGQLLNDYVLKLLHAYGLLGAVEGELAKLVRPGGPSAGRSCQDFQTWWGWMEEFFFHDFS